MPFSSRPPLCVASAEAPVLERAVSVLASLGHDVVPAPSLVRLRELAPTVRTAVVDLEMPDLGANPMATLRADPGLHGMRIVPFSAAEVEAIGRGGADPVLLALLLRVELQVQADRQAELLADLGRRLTALPEMAATMEALLDAVGEHVPSDTSTLFLVDARGSLVARAARGYELDDAVLRAVPVGQGVVGWVAENRVATIVGDSDIDARFENAASRGSRSMLAAPVMAGDRVVGALTLVRRAPANQFGDADLTLLATIATSAGIALENARLFERERDVTECLFQVEQTLGMEQATLRRLETYDRLYTQVVAMVSHELKTPLMSIRGFAKLIADGEVDVSEVRDFGHEIHDNAVRLSRYVEEILDEDAVNSGRLSLRIDAVDVGALVADVLTDMRTAAGTEHTLVDAVSEGLPRVAGDAERLRQVLVNLVSNAIKYSPDGGPVEVHATTEGDRVLITVSDSGIGIPTSERQRVFDRFYRVTSDETRSIGGTGLGLSIVRGIVELHGGRIWIEDGEGGIGTRFRVSLNEHVEGDMPSPDQSSTRRTAYPVRRPMALPAARRRIADLPQTNTTEDTPP